MQVDEATLRRLIREELDAAIERERRRREEALQQGVEAILAAFNRQTHNPGETGHERSANPR